MDYKMKVKMDKINEVKTDPLDIEMIILYPVMIIADDATFWYIQIVIWYEEDSREWKG